MIEYIKGNLFSSEAPALAHGCNTMGKMGAGIAKDFKFRYLKMFKEYRVLCGEGKFNLGEGYLYKTADGLFIFNLATQGSLSGATEESILSAFKWMRERMELDGIERVAMPKIGCGLGGLDWEIDVRPLLQDVFDLSDIVVEVWES